MSPTQRLSLSGTAALLLLLLCCCCLPSAVRGDACTFNLNIASNMGTATSPAAVQECFDAIPFSTEYRDNTVAVLRDVFNLYSFSDISADSGAPFYLKVDLFAELDRIGGTTYSNDYAMVVDIQRMFKKLHDAHTDYTAPTPYSGWNTIRPFIFSVSVSNNNMVFTINAETTAGGATFSQIHNFAYGSDPSTEVTGAVGKVVTLINGRPILDVVQEYADEGGLYKSPGVRLNAALKGGFAVASASTTPFLNLQNDTYTFDDGTSLTLSLPAFNLKVDWTDIGSFQALLHRSATKRDQQQQEQQRLSPYLLGMRTLSPFEQTMRQEELSRRLLDSRSSLQVLNSSLENAVVAGVISLSGQDYVVLQINSFATSVTDTQAIIDWILSFQTAVKVAVDYGEANNIPNLILDVSGNGGGFICLSPNTLRVLYPGYANKGPAAVASYDLRLAGAVDSKYYTLGQLAAESGYTKVCGDSLAAVNDTAWYFPTVLHTRGGKTSRYTNPQMFSDVCYRTVAEGGAPFQYNDPAGLNWTPTYFFNKIIALTDGTCGSSCSQFLSRAMSDNTVYTISYGGRLGDTTAMDTSSFCGGNVEDWTNFVASVNARSQESGITLSDLPTTASTKFNKLEFYASGATLPREFTLLPANAHLQMWPYQGGDIIDALYGAAAEYFAQAPTLPTTLQCNKATPGGTGSSSSSSRLSVPFSDLYL